jgi:hypothetical protein
MPADSMLRQKLLTAVSVDPLTVPPFVMTRFRQS